MIIQYYAQTRKDIIEKIVGLNLMILDLGCGEGKTLKYLKDKKIAKYVLGIDSHSPSIKKARKICDKVIEADLDEFDFKFIKNKFDVIIAADVLEHCKDPWRILNILKNVLKKDGKLIVSLPNIRNIKIIKNLIFKKDFYYNDKGILDKTHLRFFTKKSAIRMFDQAGYKISQIDKNLPELNKILKIIDWFLGGKLNEWYVVQWIFVLSRDWVKL